MTSAVMKNKVDLIHGPILKSLILFAIPIFFSNIFQQFYNTMDTMIVGNTLGDSSLAAIGSCSAIYDLLIGFALGIGSGLSIVTARSFGSSDKNLLKKSVACSIVIGIAVSLFVTVLGNLILYPLLELLKTPAEIIDEAYSYISTITQFTIIMFSYNLCAGLLRAVGNSVMPLIFLVLSSLLNIGLDYLLITNFYMGVRGAAVATVISQAISVLLCMIYILKKVPLLIPEKHHFTFDQSILVEMMGQGLSMGFMNSIVSAGSVILQYGINGLGTLIIAGHTAARKLYMFFNMPFAAMAVAMGTFIPQNKGANQKDRILKGMKIVYLYDLVMAALVTVVLLICSEPLVKMISGSSEMVVIQNGSTYLKVVGPFYAVLGILIQTRNGLQGLGAKVVPLISSVIELIGKIAFVILLIPFYGYTAVIFCEPVIWCVMTIQLLYSFFHHPYIRNPKN